MNQQNENTSKSGENFQHWRLDNDETGVAWLCLDKQDTSTNVLSRDVMNEFATIVSELATNPPAGLVICSAKDNSFIAGADINMFPEIETEQQAFELITRAHEQLAKFEALPCTTVAMINGHALGGGLELALACDLRVAATDSRPTLGFPEVQLGLHPGFGGTVRAVRLIGIMKAMPLMLTGKSVRPKKALDIGLVDKVVPPEELRETAARMARTSPPRRSRSVLERFLHFGTLRSLLAGRMRRGISARANPG